MAFLAEITCVPLVIPIPPPQINIPFLGKLQQIRESMYKIPDASEAIGKLLNTLQVALAPVRQFLEQLEIILCIKDCVEAIPKAILTLSPDPVFKCLKKLIETIARLASYFPPMSYVKMLVDVLAFALLLIDAVVLTIATIDAEITRLIESLDIAAQLDDVALLSIVNCGSGELAAMSLSLLDLIKVVQLPLRLAVEPVLRLIPNEDAQKAAAAIVDIGAAIELQREGIEALTSMAQLGPALAPVYAALQTMRSALVVIHNIMAPVVGLPGVDDRTEFPAFVNV